MEAIFRIVDPPLPPTPAQFESGESASKSSWKLLVLALILGAGAKLCGPYWLQLIFEASKPSSVAGVAAFLAAFALAIVLHEAGHFLAALSLHFEILGVSLGPLRATRFHDRWTMQLSANWFAGSVSAIPREDHSWRQRMLVVVAAGPTATFLTGLISGIILFNCQLPPWAQNLLGTLTQLSLLLFVLGLIPNGTKSQARNDMRLFCSLLHDTPEAEEILAYALVTQLVVAGVRPNEYPERLIRRLAKYRRRPDMSLLFAYTIVLWAIDRGDIESADAWDARALEISALCDLRFQNLSLARSGFFDVLFRSDLGTAVSKFAHVNFQILSPRYFMHRAKAAYFLTVGCIDEALAEISRASFSFPNRLPYYQFERSLLRELHKKAIEIAELRTRGLLSYSGANPISPR